MNSEIPYTRLMRQYRAAEKIGKPRQYVSKLIRLKRIKGYQIDGLTFVDYAELEQYEWTKRNPE